MGEGRAVFFLFRVLTFLYGVILYKSGLNGGRIDWIGLFMRK
jgi:hypothetical protein